MLHYSFLIAVIIENKPHPYSILILFTIALFLGLFYINKIKPDRSRFKKIDLLLVLFTSLGAAVTYWLNIELNLGAVLSAGITGLLSSFLPYINRKSDILRELPVAIYCGSFAGMTAPFIAKGYSFIILAGLFSGLLLIFSKETLQGYGGKLGTIAFGGVLLMSVIAFLIY